jgi:hypothetical protein
LALPSGRCELGNNQGRTPTERNLSTERRGEGQSKRYLKREACYLVWIDTFLPKMSSRFVSGGVIDGSGEAAGGAEDVEVRDTEHKGGGEAPRNAEWEAVQKELEDQRREREERRAKAASGEERSLYDILQANKGAFPFLNRAARLYLSS